MNQDDRADFDQLDARLAAMQAQLDGVELRLAQVEPIVAEIPALKAYMGRLERLVLLVQGEVKTMQRTADSHHKAVEEKLDVLLRYMQPTVTLP